MAEEAFDAFIQARNEVDLYDDVLPALEQLRSRYRLFTASNGNADLTRSASRTSSSARRRASRRRAQAGSGDLPQGDRGHRLAGGGVVYVGDDPHLDVEGARGAGMQAIWIDREGVEWPAEIAPPAHTSARWPTWSGSCKWCIYRDIRSPRTRPRPNCLAKTVGLHSAPFVVPLPAFFSGLASRVIDDPCPPANF